MKSLYVCRSKSAESETHAMLIPTTTPITIHWLLHEFNHRTKRIRCFASNKDIKQALSIESSLLEVVWYPYDIVMLEMRKRYGNVCRNLKRLFPYYSRPDSLFLRNSLSSS
jgi:hypothetical protein